MKDCVGQQIGNYRLIRFLGEGSFAEVYLGEHVYLKRPAAIKVLRGRLVNDGMEGFLTEASAIASLEHPHIVRVLEFGVEASTPFLVMSYAPNGTLRQRHSKSIPLPPSIILPYVKQVAAALQFVHDKKLIHRDIKPHNMLLGPNNEIWLSDFGIVVAAHTTGSLILEGQAGTLPYIAPEQILKMPRPASDQYALGIMVYEWLCGKRPFDELEGSIIHHHVHTPPPALREQLSTISPAVENVVLKALAKNPKERFDTVQAFAFALEQACQLEPYLLPALNFVLPLPPREGLPPTSLDPVELPPLAQTGSAIGSLNSSAPTAAVLVASLPAAQDAPDPESLNSSAFFLVLHTPTKPLSLQPNPLSVPGTPAPSQTQAWLKRNLSRRTVLAGLVGSAVVVGGGVVALKLILYGSSSTQGRIASLAPIVKPTPTATPRPQGTKLYTYRGHIGEVKAVAWSPDSTRIASGSLDKTVQVWDATTGKHVITHRGHSNEVKAVAWSLDGKRIASASLDRNVLVWNAETVGPPISTYDDLFEVRTVAWSPQDKQLIAFGGGDKKVHVWNADTKSILYSYSGHSQQVITVAWSPEGTRIASASADGTVQVWDALTGASSFPYRGHSNWVRAVAWSHNGQYLASGGTDTTVQVWDAKSGQHMYTYPGHSQEVQAVAWSPDGKRIASASFDKTVQVWDAFNGGNVYIYPGHSNQAWGVAWSPDGTRIASASLDKTVQVWQA
jgi:eukaryotic-like serine/threonine-protein kinase